LASSDPIVREHYPWLFEQFSAFKKLSDDPSRLYVLAELSLLRMKSYNVQVRKRIHHQLREKLFDSEYEIIKLLQIYISSLIWRGNSDSQVRIFLSEVSSVPIGVLSEEFINQSKLFVGQRKRYRCSAVTNWPKFTLDCGFESLDIRLHKSGSDFTTDIEQEFFEKHHDKQSLIASQEISARDAFTAKNKFIRSLSKAFSIISFYQSKLEHQIKGQEVSVVNLKNQVGDSRVVSVRSEQFLHMRKASKIRDRIRRVAKIRKIQYSRHFDTARRLETAFEYHRLSLNSLSDEIKLVNLWISLETLISDDKQAAIGSVTNYLSSVVASSYIYSSVKSLGNKIKHDSVYGDLLKHDFMKRSDNKQIDTVELLKILVDKDDGDMVGSFKNLKWNNATIMQRVDYLREYVLKEPKLFKRKLLHERERVYWQLLRIYRERNNIAHRGKTSKIIHGLLDNLMAYHNAALRSIIRDLEHNSEWNIDHAIEYRKSVFKSFLETLKDKNSTVNVTVDRLLDPIDSRRLGEVQEIVWPI